MSVFYKEEPPQQTKRCKYLAAALKDAFSQCRTFNGKVSTPGQDEEYPTSDLNDEQEFVVSAIRSGAMEKLRRKPIILIDSFSWVSSSSKGELDIALNELQQEEDNADDERDEFFSVASCFSHCSSREAFMSLKAANFSVSSSLNGFDHQDLWRSDLQDSRRRSIIQEFCQCEGWPFGLCRKTVLLPPLPKSPSESWSWRKRT